jgi:hypothetical protein
LQALTAFIIGGYEAYTKKQDMLRTDRADSIGNKIIDFLRKPELTTEQLLKIVLLFKKSEKMKLENINNDNKRTPITHYILSFMGEDFKNSDNSEYIFDSVKAETIFTYYEIVARNYYADSQREGIDYNVMIKQKIDRKRLDNAVRNADIIAQNHPKIDSSTIEEFKKSKVEK